LCISTCLDTVESTDERETLQEVQPAWENSSLGLIEAVIKPYRNLTETSTKHLFVSFGLDMPPSTVNLITASRSFIEIRTMKLIS